MTSPTRFFFLDTYRGLAVILMAIFHFCWDLRYFGYLEYHLSDPFWVGFRAVILTLFLSAVGWSNYLSVRANQTRHRYAKNLSKLIAAASLVTVGSWFMFPSNWIFFGILHFIFVASVIARPFANAPILSMAIGVLLVLLPWLHIGVDMAAVRQWFTSTLGMPARTLDYVAPLPWLGVVFIGPILGKLGLHKFQLSPNRVISFLQFCGKFALPIYLLHQVLLFAFVAGIHFLATTLIP